MPSYFDFHVSLAGIEPRIHRRFLIRTAGTFAELHRAIQDAFGWSDYHLWEFRVAGRKGRVIAGVPPDEEDGFDDVRVPDAREVKLRYYFSGERATEWCQYIYDFGDGWEHEVKLLGVVSDAKKLKRRLLDGARACPPEDCGGPHGYERMVHYVRTGEDLFGEPDDLGEWLGDWKPDDFDLEAARASFDK